MKETRKFGFCQCKGKTIFGEYFVIYSIFRRFLRIIPKKKEGKKEMVKMFHSVYAGQCRSAVPTYRTYAHPLHIPPGGREKAERQIGRERGRASEREEDRNVNIEMCSIVTSVSYGKRFK